MELTGNTILITGGGSGIGLALARALASRDNRVVICGRSPEKLDAAVRECAALSAMICDVTQETHVAALAERMQRDFGGINILVNNAGAGQAYSLAKDPLSAQKALAEIQVNLVAPILLTSVFMNQLRAKPNGAIINVSSGLAVCPSPVCPGYSASKAGLHAFTRVLRIQLRGTPIRVFEVLPSVIDTDMVRESAVRKMRPEIVAARILQGMEKDCFEIAIGGVRWMRWASRWMPGVLEKVLTRYPFSLRELDARYET